MAAYGLYLLDLMEFNIDRSPEDSLYIGCASVRGDLKWRFHAKRAITSSPTINKQMVLFSSVDGTLYALDHRNGFVIWRFRLGKGSVSSPTVVDNIVFLGAADGFIYAIDAGTSKELWRFRTEHQVSSSPVVYKDSLYCGSIDGYLYCLEYRTGRLRWKFGTEGHTRPCRHKWWHVEHAEKLRAPEREARGPDRCRRFRPTSNPLGQERQRSPAIRSPGCCYHGAHSQLQLRNAAVRARSH